MPFEYESSPRGESTETRVWARFYDTPTTRHTNGVKTKVDAAMPVAAVAEPVVAAAPVAEPAVDTPATPRPTRAPSTVTKTMSDGRMPSQ